MAAITEATFVNRVRQRADMESNDFVSDLEVQTYINAGLSELHDILIQTYGQDYYVTSVIFTTVADQDSYSISTYIGTDFYKLRGVDAQLNGSEYFTLRPFNFNERNMFQNWGSWSLLGLTNIRYRMVGGNLVFSPKPDRATQVQVWYIPIAQQFVSTTPATSTTTFDDINGYGEYVVIDAAIKCLQKEESDVQILLSQKQAMKRRIEESADNRDAGSPLQVNDIYAENNWFWFSGSTD